MAMPLEQSLYPVIVEQKSIDVLLEEVEPVIRAAVRHKLRVTLSATDYREQNLDAQDVLSEIRLKLVRKLSANQESESEQSENQQSKNKHSENNEPESREPAQGAASSRVEDFRAYAATAAYHCCADYLRAKHPERASLKNLLRRVMEKLPGFAVWQSPDGDLLCGYAGWPGQKKPNADQASVAKLRNSPGEFPAAANPRKHLNALTAQDWQALLDGILTYLGGPLSLDDLIAIVAPIVGMQDSEQDTAESSRDDDERPTAIEQAPSREPSSYSIRLAVERLTLLWIAIAHLLPWHRISYLLNMPDGDLDAFPYYGVATRQQIGEALALKDTQFEAAWIELKLDAEAREKAMGTRRYVKKFAILWQYIPLEDNIIAKMLGVTRPQVIGYRSKALERLRRHMKCVR
jgi:hypothetical protein